MKEPHNNICLFDMDGTLCDFDGEMRRQLKPLECGEEEGFSFPSDLFETGTTPDWLEARKKLIKSQPGFWRGLKPIQRGFEVLRIAKNLGFENHVLTQGPRTTNAAWVEKKEWCDEHLPDFCGITITQKKSLSYGRVLVDDWPSYFLPWLKVRPRGLVVAIAQEWNKDATHPNLVRYDGNNLDEVRERMLEAKQRD